jgi:hypothetical protein
MVKTELPSVGIVLNSLWKDFTTAHVLDIERQPFSVLDLVLVNSLETSLLELAVAGPDDFAARVHGHGGLLPSHFDENSSLVIAQGHIVGATQNA